MDSLQHRVKASSARYNGGKRKGNPLGIVMHCTAGDRGNDAIGWLNRMLKNGESKASYNYVIEKDGTILRMCRPDVIAYHAGLSSWHSLPSKNASLNHCTIGIAFANDNGSDGDIRDDELTIYQLEAGLWLCSLFCREYSISTNHILGHIEVSPGRKFDPLPRILDMDHWRAQVRQNMIDEDNFYHELKNG
jgi:N-acetylmuramoyl-L-alanine amidase